MPVTIGLWGGGGSGKTTYLASLSHATYLDKEGRWNITGRDTEYPGSTVFLARSRRQLDKGRFPDPTASISRYGYDISGTPTPASLIKAFVNQVTGRQVGFSLYLEDRPGEDYATIEDPKDPLWEHLGNCNGLVYLYDHFDEDNVMYVEIASSMIKQNTPANHLINGKMPHYIAMCITKIDRPEILEKLRYYKLVAEEIYWGFRTLTITNPQKAFSIIADPLTHAMLANNFLTERIKYFAISSIGFYTDNDGSVDIRNYWNVVQTAEGARIRGRIRPVNVLSPLIWLATQPLPLRHV